MSVSGVLYDGERVEVKTTLKSNFCPFNFSITYNDIPEKFQMLNLEGI